MSTQQATVSPGYDIPSNVAKVVEATRHLRDFRTGYAETLAHLAEQTATLTHHAAMALLEPLLRILGTERAARFAGQLVRIAQDTTGDWYEGKPDWDEAARTLRVVCEQAAHEVADEFHRDNRICRDATKETNR